MLPANRRMRSSDEFRPVIRDGVRAGGAFVVVHMRADHHCHVGFVVSKKVGGAVTRNRVKRRLRHLVAPLVSRDKQVSAVVRALPASAGASSRELGDDLTRCWNRAARRVSA